MSPTTSDRLARSVAGARMVVVAAGALLAVAACAGEPPEAQPGVNGSDIELTDPADTATWTIDVTAAPSTATVPPLPVLTALRAGTHPDFERVTLEVSGAGEGDAAAGPDGRPGYRLAYVDRPLTACGSGEQIFPVGEGWLEIRLEPAAAHTEEGRATLGPREVEVDGPLLQRIYRTCDFEGIVTHVLALGSPNQYRVFTLPDPLRIVVDVRYLPEPELRTELMVMAVDTLHRRLRAGDLINQTDERALHPRLLANEPGSVGGWADEPVPEDLGARLGARPMMWDDARTCGDDPGTCRMPDVPAIFGVSRVVPGSGEGEHVVRVSAMYRTESARTPVAQQIVDVVFSLEDGEPRVRRIVPLMTT